VAELGAGLMLTQPQVNAATLRAAAARLLAEPNFAAAATRIGDSFRAAGGMPRAADEVETLLRTRTGSEARLSKYKS
jgi:UDP:flavonoid glycosyltransferase YjiC (YdhE family)